MRALFLVALSLALACGGKKPDRPDGSIPDAPDGGFASFFDRVRHLVDGGGARQRDVDLDALDPSRVIRVFGYVKDDSDAPLSGVRVELLSEDASPFGWTETRADGRFDLVVHAASRLVVRYRKEGFLESQRLLRPTRPNEHVAAPEVVLVPLDPIVTTVRAGEVAIARGSRVDDGDGARQATLLFPEGLSASAELPDGTRVPLSTLSVRATEYTVGARGPARMPGTMPRQIAYTYAVELSVDEAESMGATGVAFDRPVPFYVDNFLGMPVGGVVPTGFYDRRRGEWIPVDDGRVIAIIGREGELATIDVDGDGAADADLSALGIDEEERRRLASLYTDGTQLWRVPLTHFSPYDCNWPFRLPGDATSSSIDPASARARTPCPREASGSIIECENQGLAEEVAVLGTGHVLRHSSERAPGNRDAFTVRIPLLAVDDRSPSLKRIDVRSVIEGQLHERSGLPEDFLLEGDTFFDEWVWDGRDADGNRLHQPATAWNEVCLVYDGLPVDVAPEASSGAAFGSIVASGASVTVDRTGMEAYVCRSAESEVGVWDVRSLGLLGWSLSSLSTLDLERGQVLAGSGGALPTRQRRRGFTRFAGYAGGEDDPAELVTGAPALDVPLRARSVFVDDQSRVVVFGEGTGLWRIEHDRTVSLWPGTEDLDVDLLFESNGLVLGDDGNLYVLEDRGGLTSAATLSRITPDGERTLLAGGVSDRDCCGSGGCGAVRDDRLGDGGDPLAACLSATTSHQLAYAPDGALLFVHDGGRRLRRFGPEGRLSTVLVAADTDVLAADGTILGRVDRFDDGPWVTPEGRIWLLGSTDRFSYTVRDRRIAGAVLLELREDGRLVALSAFDDTCTEERRPNVASQRSAALADVCFFETGLDDIEWGPSGETYLLFAGRTLHRLSDGRLRHVAGTFAPILRTQPHSEDEGLEDFPLGAERDFAVLPNGDVVILSDFFFDFEHAPVASAFGPLYVVGGRGERLEADGIHVSLGGWDYVFSAGGLPMRATSRFVPSAQTRFDYAAAPAGMPGVSGDVVTAIVAPDGNSLRVERASASHVILTAPFGEQTHLHDDDGDGYADRIRYEGDAHELSFEVGRGDEEGLLRAMVDRTGARHEYAYDDGRLVRDERVGVGAQTLALDPPRYTFGVQRFAVDRTSAEGYVTRYEVADSEPTELFDGQIDRRIVYPDGTEASTSRSADRSRSSASDSTGTTSEADYVTDPIGDADGYVPTRSVVVTPEGRRLEVRSETTATLAPDTTRSVSAWSETVTVAPETLREASFTRTFDPGTRTWTLTSAEGRVARSVLDEAGRLVRLEPPGQHPLVYTYDARGRLERVERGEGSEQRITTLTYGPRSRHPERIEGSDRRRVTPSFDALGRVSTVTDSAGRTSTFTYDEPTRSTTFAGPGGEAHTMEFDLLGGLSSYTPPVADEGGIPWSIARDGDGVLDAFTLGDGRSVSLELDDVGRPEALVLARGRSVTTYDPATGQVDTVSMPTRDGDASVTIDLDFDGPLLTRQAWSGVVNGAVAFDYDERWQLDFVQVGASAPIEYAFDRDGLVTRAGPMTITRDPIRGLPVATTVGRVTTELVVDAFGAPERRAASWPGGGFSTEVTDFDPAGRIEEIVETDGGTATTYRYEYDDAGRLETVRRNGREIATYDYDLRGNRDAWSDERGAMSATFDAQDRLGSTSGALARSYVHDGHGRVTSWTDSTGTTRLEVDELGNLLGVELPDGTEITYEVDALGRRVARAVDGVRTHAWLYQGDRPIAELDPDGDVRAVFVYASHALAPELMLADGRTYRLVHDHLGSIRRVVDTATGEVVQALDFDAYGRVLRDTNPGFQPFGYAAGHYDPQTGLVRYGARDYDAAIGRWLAKDPILIAGGDTNLYAYVTGDPVNFVDPDGHNPLFWGLMVGLATGAASDQGNDGESDPVAVFGGVVLGGAFKAASVGVSFLWRGLRPCPAPPPANAAATTGASSGASQTSTVLLRTSRNLQKFFGKHGADFGLSGKWNPSRAADASRAIHQHINNPGVRSIQGSYRGNPATHYLDPNTGLNVVADSAGNFVTGYRLGSGQLTDLLATGHLF